MSKCCLKSACRGQTSKHLANLAESRGWSENSSDLEGGLHPPLPDPAKLNKVSHCHKPLCKPSEEQLPVRGVTSAYVQKCSRAGTKSKISRVFNRLFLVPKPNNKWRPILDLSKLNLFLKAGKFKMETPETIRTSLQQGEWVTSIDFKDAYFHIPIQEQSRKYLRFHVEGQTYQFKALPFGLSTAPLGVHCSGKGGETDGNTQGYNNPPVPRRLVGESQVPLSLSPAYTGPGENVSRPRLAGKVREIRTGTQAGFQLRRLPVRPQVRSFPTHTGPVAEPPSIDTDTVIPTGLSGPAVHVFDRSANSHRETSSPRSITYETHTMASPEQLENTRITKKGHSNTQIPAPHLQWWLEESNVLQGQPLHPIKPALQIFKDASKEGWGAHLNEHTARGSWSLPESKLHINYLELKAVLALKEFQDLC